MTLIRRDINTIYNTSRFLEEEKQNLLLAKTKLMADLDNLFNKYQGIDAKTIEVKFKEAINRLDSLIERVDYYSKYMNGVVNHDQENIQNTTKALTTLLTNAPNSNNASIPNTFSLNNDSSFESVPFKTIPLAKGKTYIGRVDNDR